MEKFEKEVIVEKEVEQEHKEIQFTGMDIHKIVIVNEMIFKLDEDRKAYENAVKQFKLAIKDYKEQVWFLEVSKKDSPKEEERYNDIRKSKLDGLQGVIEGHERALGEQQELHDNLQSFIDVLNTHIEFDVRIDDKGKKDYIAIYDDNFFTPIARLAEMIGWIDLDEGKKKKK